MSLYKTINVRSTSSHPKRYYVNAVYPEIPPTAEDKYIITSVEDKLDLLAFDYYGDETLWWVISRANPDVTRRDSFFIKMGVQVRIPDVNIIESLKEEFESLNAAR